VFRRSSRPILITTSSCSDHPADPVKLLCAHPGKCRAQQDRCGTTSGWIPSSRAVRAYVQDTVSSNIDQSLFVSPGDSV
jgi:hypothetical protein